MVSRSDLPLELAIMILEHVQDHKTLDALRRTSRCFAQGFQMIGVSLANNLMQQTTLDKRVRLEMVLYAQTVSGRFRSARVHTAIARSLNYTSTSNCLP